MSVPYSQAISQILGNHTYVKHNGSWQTVEDIRIKDGGTWRDTKAVYVKQGGTWRTVHEGDFFLFNYVDSSNSQSTLNLSSILSNAGYSSGAIKGAITINCKRRRVNLGNYSGKVYLRVNSGKKISGAGGNGGNRGGQNGQDGQDALYSGGTPFILDNAGIIAGGGGGGGGGKNDQCTYQNTYYYGCMKGNQCEGTDQQFSQALGGGGGGGAGYPAGQGKHGGNNGTETGGGGGGGSNGCGSQNGGKGGNLGQNGQGATNGGSGGTKGRAVTGINHRFAQVNSGDGDLRGGTQNT